MIFFLWEQHAQCGLDLRHVTVIELVGTYPAQIGRIRHMLLPPGLALQLRYSQQAHTHTHSHTHALSQSVSLARPLNELDVCFPGYFFGFLNGLFKWCW